MIPHVVYGFGIQWLSVYWVSWQLIIMDCTNKTNKYNYPLLEIVGVTSTNMTFVVAFAFLDQEKKQIMHGR